MCIQKNKKQYLHDHYVFKKTTYLTMIDSNRKYHDILSYRMINDFQQKCTAAATFRPQDCIEYTYSTNKAIRISNNTLDSNKEILNI